MRFLKKALLVLLLLILVPVVAGVSITALAYTAGTVRVEVDAPEGHFAVPVPAGLIPLAARFVPREACRDLPPEVSRQWDALRAAAEEIERIPDAVLVEVEGRNDEHVLITKRGDGFAIDVNSGRERVHVSFPARTVSSVAYHAERICG